MGTVSDDELARERDYDRRMAEHQERQKAFREERGMPTGYLADDKIGPRTMGSAKAVVPGANKMQPPPANKAQRATAADLEALSLKQLQERAAHLGITVVAASGNRPTKADYVRALSE